MYFFLKIQKLTNFILFFLLPVSETAYGGEGGKSPSLENWGDVPLEKLERKKR